MDCYGNVEAGKMRQWPSKENDWNTGKHTVQRCTTFFEYYLSCCFHTYSKAH